MLGKMRARGEGGDREWDVWIVSPTQWTGVWANFRRQGKTEEPALLQSTVSQRAWHNLATNQQEQQQNAEISTSFSFFPCVRRYKSLGSLKLFLWCASYLSRASMLFFSILNPPQGAIGWLMTIGWQPILFTEMAGNIFLPIVPLLVINSTKVSEAYYG